MTASHLPANPFDENVETLRHRLGTINTIDERDELPGAMQAEATMALAYEQRTANLLNLFRHIDRQGDMPDHAGKLFNEVAGRLGLQEAP